MEPHSTYYTHLHRQDELQHGHALERHDGIPGPAGNGYLAQTITANADHELLRNLLVTLNASYENYSFQGITRTDNFFTASAGLKYLVNRNLFLGGAFSYYQRSSSLAGSPSVKTF